MNASRLQQISGVWQTGWAAALYPASVQTVQLLRAPMKFADSHLILL